ncbi:hypothetical protein QWY31_04750 [Cytophagales bacterium LB-30]|uniref:YceI family protein n=1 Tax=Shiella aurantiaca TaxID=3058365 RepID=A0ABT8F2W6_9BACT|nr:hypothetical protein [Shiella aurantiaca]MDN4164797.1 hypothetical protein [Shiella aurantiaca]
MGKLFFIFFIALIQVESAYTPKRFLLIYEKQVVIKGNTSLGDFTCQIKQSHRADTLAYVKNKPYTFHLPVGDFGCGNFLLNRDFQHTLQAEDFPLVKVGLINPQDQEKYVLSDVMVGLAGKEVLKPQVQFKKACVENRMVLVSTLSMRFAEFGLTPPNRLGGLVQVDDHITIEVEVAYQ